MSYRWGQDYGTDADLFSAKYQELDGLFNDSEDLVDGCMHQIVDIVARITTWS